MSETPAENTAPATATEGDAAPATEAAVTPKEGGETPAPEGEGSANASEGSKADKEKGKESKSEEEAKPSVPEKYDFTPPEGMEIDKDALKSYEDLAREHGLSQDQFDAVTQHGLEFFQNRLSDLASQHAAREEGWKADDLNKHSATLQAAETRHRSLRPNLPDDYTGYMRKMFSEGAGMAVLMMEGKAKSVAVYRSFHTTFQGHRFYIDDLVTDATERSRGYGHRILAWCEEGAHRS